APAATSPPASPSAVLQSTMPAAVLAPSRSPAPAVALYVTPLILCLACGHLLRGRRRRSLLGGCRERFAAGVAGRRLAFGSLALGGVPVLRDEVRHLDPAVSALGDPVGQHPHDERRRADRVVVPGDHE